MGDQNGLETKLGRYRSFWNRTPVHRPLLGFDVGGFYPLQKYSSLQELGSGAELLPSMLDPADLLDAYEEAYESSTSIDDDFIRGASPISAVPWMEAMLGCRVRIAKDSIWAEERGATWDEMETIEISDDNPWLKAYLRLLEALAQRSAGRFPVSQPILRGVSDLLGSLRGHSQALIDCMESPGRVRRAVRRCADALIEAVRRHYAIVTPFHGGYSVEQYSLWSPKPIIRLQEDASSVYSPTLYRELIQPEDRRVAAAFPACLVHLHSASLFLLSHFLEIEGIDIVQINRDAVGVHLEDMMGSLRQVQNAGRLLLLRGDLDTEEIELIARELSPTGLMVQIVVQDPKETGAYTEVLTRCWTER